MLTEEGLDVEGLYFDEPQYQVGYLMFPEWCQMFTEWCQLFPEWCQMFPEWCQCLWRQVFEETGRDFLIATVSWAR